MATNPNPRAIAKTPVLVELSLADGSNLIGNIFVHSQARLSDVLNDDRKFLPVQTIDGRLMAIAKTHITQVSLPAAEAAIYRGSDPYKVLGVQPGVSAEELKRAYHQLCMQNHPDRIRGFGLGAEYQELGTKNTARINEAYAHLLKTVASAAA